MEELDRRRVAGWIADYERAWRSPGTEALAQIFTEDAAYSRGPYEPLREGIAEIEERWEEEREGPDEPFTMTSEIVAVDGDTAVARVEIAYGRSGNEYRDLWVMRFAGDGRVRAYEEWPFWPEQTVVPPGT